MDAHGTKRVGREVETSTKRPPKTFPDMPILSKAFYVVEHKILKIEHQNYHFRVPKPKMWDNGMKFGKPEPVLLHGFAERGTNPPSRKSKK